MRQACDDFLFEDASLTHVSASYVDPTKPTAAVMAAAAPQLLDEPTVISSDEEQMVVTDSDVRNHRGNSSLTHSSFLTTGSSLTVYFFKIKAQLYIVKAGNLWKNGDEESERRELNLYEKARRSSRK